MCLQCVVDAEHVDIPIEGWYLARSRRDRPEWPKGWWGLGQLNDPVVVFQVTPISNPTEDLSDDELDAAPDDVVSAWMRFLEQLHSFEERLVMGPVDGHDLYERCREAGYDPDRDGHHLAHWLFSELGKAIERTGVREPQTVV